MTDNRGRFFAFFTLFSAEIRPIRLVIPPKPPESATISRKCGGKTPISPPHRKPPGTPRLWPHLAEIAKLAKTAVWP
jgi:hypothetical protein